MPNKKKPIPKQIVLNEEQQAVVSAREGFWKIEAGPGAGKSACLVSRFASLIQEGVSPDDILSLSFTKTAAKNLRDRVESLVGTLTTTRIAGAVTFHSLALSLAQEERDEYPFTLAEFPLATEPVAYKLASESARRYELDPRSFRPMASLYRRHRICPAEAVRDAEAESDPKQLKMALAYKDYEKRSRAEGLLDFDSLIYYAVEILSKKPAVRARWVRDWLQLDEAQDMSKIEWDLAKLISGKSVCAVGDISQGIYGFRGSDAKLFSEMEEIFPGTKTLYLGCNYRSTPEIVDFIRPIAASQDLAEKFHTQNGPGPKPEIRGFTGPVDEAKWVVSKIKEELCKSIY
jgi:DNA helicase-2/ATP-dependent DNA helicase PcrA